MILTHHYVHNEGAILQAYAQAKLLDMKIIDYRIKAHYDVQLGTKRSEIFEDFISQLPLTEQLITNDYEEAREFIQQFNTLVIGSDEVWKLGGSKKYGKPYPNVYWPDTDNRKIAVAASANRLDYEALDDDILDNMKERLGGFDILGVRDNHTLGFIEKLGLRAEKVPDPTIAYEFLESEYSIDQDKVLGVRVSNTKAFRETLAEFSDYRIVSLSIGNKFADENLTELNPFEWIGAIRSLDFLITDSYHHLIFALKYSVPVLVIDNGYKTESKTYDLLKDLDMLYCHTDTKNYINRIPEIKERYTQDNIKEKLKKLELKYLEFAGRVIN